MISNCGHDENNKYSGGAAGDQTGSEWRLIGWYNRPWNVVLRHPDAGVRSMISNMATAAAKNDKIGYDQGQRLTFWNQLSKVGYKPENISTACEADCSSGVAAIVKGAGYRLGNSKLQGVSTYCWTGNLKSALVAAGFTTLTESKYLTSDAYLLPGDVLLNEAAHTAINVSTGSKASASTSSGAPTATASAALEVDGLWGPATTRALQRALGTVQDGIVSDQYSAYKATNPGLMTASWEFKANPSGGSNVIRALQRKVGASVDGFAGPNTFKALQKHLGTTQDGVISKPSMCVKELQRRLNAGTL